MKIRSSKAKGKRAVFETRNALLRHAPELSAHDIIKPVGSQRGSDLELSARALERYPFTFEVKNQEKLNIWSAIEQSERHGKKEGKTPLLVFRRNRSELYVTLKLEDLLCLLHRPDVTAPLDLSAPLEPTERVVENHS